MSKGPQLTQRKIDKLRDALNVVRECDQITQAPSKSVGEMLGLLVEASLSVMNDLENELTRKVIV